MSGTITLRAFGSAETSALAAIARLVEAGAQAAMLELAGQTAFRCPLGETFANAYQLLEVTSDGPGYQERRAKQDGLAGNDPVGRQNKGDPNAPIKS